MGYGFDGGDGKIVEHWDVIQDPPSTRPAGRTCSASSADRTLKAGTGVLPELYRLAEGWLRRARGIAPTIVGGCTTHGAPGPGRRCELFTLVKGPQRPPVSQLRLVRRWWRRCRGAADC